MNKRVFCKEKVSIVLNSFMVAILLSSSVFYATLTLGLHTPGVSSVILIVAFSFTTIFKWLSTDLHKMNISGKQIPFILFLFIIYINSFIGRNYLPNFSVIQFAFYCIIPIIVINRDFDVQLVLKYTMYLSLVSIFAINSLLQDTAISSKFAQTDLGIAYNMLPCIIVAIFHFYYYFKSSSWIDKFCYCYYLYVLIRWLSVTVRGALITVLFSVFLIFINRYEKNSEKTKKNSSLKKINIILIGLVVLLIIANFASVISSVYVWLASKNIDIGVISKFYVYLNKNDLSDGRYNLYKVAWEGFKSHPIIGNGIMTFENYTNVMVNYPHNYVLQLLFEGGIVFGLPIIYFSIRELLRTFKGNYVKKDDFVMSAILISLGLIPEIFSINIWMNVNFWALILYSLKKHKTKNVLNLN